MILQLGVHMTDYPYVTIVQGLIQNAERHKANGDRYMLEGKPDYAEGSYRKAAKNMEQAKVFTEFGCTQSFWGSHDA